MKNYFYISNGIKGSQRVLLDINPVMRGGILSSYINNTYGSLAIPDSRCIAETEYDPGLMFDIIGPENITLRYLSYQVMEKLEMSSITPSLAIPYISAYPFGGLQELELEMKISTIETPGSSE